ARAEADSPSQLFQYYLLDTSGFERNPLVAVIPGVNDGNAQKTATGANCGQSTVGAVRLVVEPKPGLPTDPNSVRAFIDVFTDISGLFVINNESGWYEGWMIHDLTVPDVAPPRRDGHAQFGKLTAEDAEQLARMGSGNNRSGRIFTMDGNAVHFPSESDRFPDRQTNIVPIQLSMGAYNALQQADAHAYWEFNYTTNWIHPLYELPFTGGFPDRIGGAADAFEEGEIGRLLSIVPGSGPAGVRRHEQRRHHLGRRGRRRHRQRRLPGQREALPPRHLIQPIRGDARDQRRHPGPSIRAQPARLVVAGHESRRQSCRTGIGGSRQRRPLAAAHEVRLCGWWNGRTPRTVLTEDSGGKSPAPSAPRASG